MADIGQLKRELSALESEKNTLEDKKKTADEQKKKAEKRRKSVESIRKDLDKDFDNNCKDVNKAANAMVEDAEAGIKGVATASKLYTAVDDDLESYPESDSFLKQAMNQFDEEVSALDTFVDNKKAEIDQYSRDIKNKNSAINSKKWEIAVAEREERERKREEALKNMVNKLIGK